MRIEPSEAKRKPSNHQKQLTDVTTATRHTKAFRFTSDHRTCPHRYQVKTSIDYQQCLKTSATEREGDKKRSGEREREVI